MYIHPAKVRGGRGVKKISNNVCNGIGKGELCIKQLTASGLKLSRPMIKEFKIQLFKIFLKYWGHIGGFQFH